MIQRPVFGVDFYVIQYATSHNIPYVNFFMAFDSTASHMDYTIDNSDG